ncbi:unnamed protein product [Ambrosiozyma monospora]|uniref:Unnamed protein product n=1 Tax=Ambrosiozyma monospora TaxID=43982 RepID=A0ACB5TU37_AMBMO|nr:unnamed protein product [Ambrosiozyma monospora]
MSHASISLLPSSFTLIMGMFATAAVINYFKYDKFSVKVQDHIKRIDIASAIEKSEDDSNDEKEILLGMLSTSAAARDKYYTLAIFSTAVGGVLGWPFAMVLIVPFLINIFITFISRQSYKQFGFYLIIGAAALCGTLSITSQIDYAFYGKTEFVSLNIMLYNVINSSESAGPNIFGVEPTSYYVINLLLNFYGIGLLSVLGLAAGIVLRVEKASFWQIETIVFPIVIWCAIFFAQPHKEERFMYPIYHLITISAAYAAQSITGVFGNAFIISTLHAIWTKIAIFIVISTVSTLRIISLIQNYGAALAVYSHLPQVSNKPENVCVGREWYVAW